MNKRHFLRLSIAAIPLVLFASPAKAAESDPVLGRWQWGASNDEFRLHADGRATQGGRWKRSGKWVCLSPKATPRKYLINWDNGKFMDTLSLVKSGAELEGQNQNGYKLRARRLPL